MRTMIVLLMVLSCVSFGSRLDGGRLGVPGIDLLRAVRGSDATYVYPDMTSAQIQTVITANATANEVSNGTFASATGWTLNDNDNELTIAGGVLTYLMEAGDTADGTAIYASGIRARTYYWYTYEIGSTSGDMVLALKAGTDTSNFHAVADGVYAGFVYTGAATALEFAVSSGDTEGDTFTLDNIEFREAPVPIVFLPGYYNSLDLTVSHDGCLLDASSPGVVLDGDIDTSGSPANSYIILNEIAASPKSNASLSESIAGDLTLTGFDDTALYPSGRRYKAVFDYAASRTLTIEDSRKVITNDGATAAVTFTLPTYSASVEGAVFYIFDIEHTAGYDVVITVEDTSGDDIIMPDDGLAAGGDSVTLAEDRHQNITVIAIDSNYHIVGYTGTLTEGS